MHNDVFRVAIVLSLIEPEEQLQAVLSIHVPPKLITTAISTKERVRNTLSTSPISYTDLSRRQTSRRAEETADSPKHRLTDLTQSRAESEESREDNQLSLLSDPSSGPRASF